ncbi:MAG TPA: hypothetical protein VGY99_00370 [Candidatus Binataceae bacterium]|nr:hypothetical protein [Candidatus Binataceae bacterium]
MNAHIHTWFRFHEIYEAGYFAGIEGNDRCPYLIFTPYWWCWQVGNFVGHHTMCSQLEAIVLHYEQD